MHDGRLDGRAVPRIGHPSPALTTSDARGGIAQTGFDEAFPTLVHTARRYGLAAFAQQGSFTCGPLGWFTERLADAGLLAVATAVAPAMLAAGAVTDQFTGRVFGTNPMAYSVPRARLSPFTVDQASSSTAFVSVRDVAAQGTLLPEGWAVDANGNPTTDPEAALAGALLPFGGYKGANIALLVELLSSMAGGNWSMDAPSWDSGSRSPSVGMFVLAVDTAQSATAPSEGGSPPAPRTISPAWPGQEYDCPATEPGGVPLRPAAWRSGRTSSPPPPPRRSHRRRPPVRARLRTGAGRDRVPGVPGASAPVPTGVSVAVRPGRRRPGWCADARWGWSR